MTVFTRDNADIYFEEQGRGEPVMVIHGLIENTSYWSLCGVDTLLASDYRVISMDMRGHARSIVHGEPRGFDVETVGEDIAALAEYLGFRRYHVLTHSTGGFAAVRYAMKNSSKFASLVLTDTASATSHYGKDEESAKKHSNALARVFENTTWEEIIDSLKKKPGDFFRGIVESSECDELLQKSLSMVKLNDRRIIAEFIRSFYRDPDPMVEGLRKISCPVLIIYGEKDDLFIESSRLMGKEIPGAEIIEYKGIGHMTALECPAQLATDVVAFLKKHPI